MSLETHLKKIALGSGSTIKKEAVRDAFPTCEILADDTAESGVPPQPVGKEQTAVGAANRAACARSRFPLADCWIGIENGMWPAQEADEVQCEMVDGANFAIWIRTEALGSLLTERGLENSVGAQADQDGVTKYSHWGETITIPSDLPFEKGPNGEWSVLKDPHSVLTGGRKSRKQYLTEGLLKFVESL